MYALIQMRAQPTHRARIIAANNILNALFMIASSLIAGALLGRASPCRRSSCSPGWPTRWWRSTSSCWCPEYLLRFVAWVRRAGVPLQGAGDETRSPQGAAVLVQPRELCRCRAADGRQPAPIYFVMDHRIFRVPVLGWLFRWPRPFRWRPQGRPRKPTGRLRARRQVCCARAICWPSSRRGRHHPRRAVAALRGGIVKILDRARADGLDVPVIPWH